VKIRSAAREDRTAVLALVPRLATTGSPPGRDAAEVERSDLQSIAQALTAPASGEALLVAEDEGQLLGFVHLKTVVDYFSQQPIAHVADIVVAKAAEGKGVGKHLMSAAEDWARTCGYTMVQLHVLLDNVRARAMYERLGYSAEWLKYIKRLDVKPPE
jgi:ribosomal protein S18 acetylase RimI-like enzyme